MHYSDGRLVQLGDVVCMPVPGGSAKARVVMIGDTNEHLAIDEQFVSWVTAEKLLDKKSVVLEWLGANPFAHDDPNYAPVGNFMFSPIDQSIVLVVD